MSPRIGPSYTFLRIECVNDVAKIAIQGAKRYQSLSQAQMTVASSGSEAPSYASVCFDTLERDPGNSHQKPGWTGGPSGTMTSIALCRADDTTSMDVEPETSFFRLYFHDNSGVILLENLGAEIDHERGKRWRSVPRGDFFALTEDANKVRIGRGEYIFEFQYPETMDDERILLGLRNEVMWGSPTKQMSYSNLLAGHAVSFFPPRSHLGAHRFGDVIVYHTQASGGFGHVCKGVHHLTGQLMATKEMLVHGKQSRKAPVHEIRVNRRLEVSNHRLCYSYQLLTGLANPNS